MNSVDSRATEKGSVLVVCLGILVVLSLMATAFISSVSMQKDASVNTRRSVILEMAVLSGKSAVLNGNIGTQDTVSTDKVARELWSFAGVTEADVTGWGFPGGTEKQTWRVISCYDKDLKNMLAAVNLADLSHPVWVRIAYVTIDCEGLWCLNPPAAGGMDIGQYKTDLAALITATGLAGVNAANASTVVDPQVFSWQHAKDVYKNDFSGSGSDAEINKLMFILSPFGTNAGMSGGTDKISIFNVNSPTVVTTAHPDGVTEIANTGNFYRATVRAQIWDNARSNVIGEKQLEFVYVKSTKKILYQRWVANE